jgi:hypothetical protein
VDLTCLGEGLLPSPTPPQLDETHTTSASTTSTTTGSRIAKNTNATLTPSSMVDSTGAAPPAVATFAAGRTVDFVSDTTSATSTPTTIGIHWPDWAKAPGSVTAAV